MNSATIHLICGSTGAGKTTYAIALADKIGGVRFSIDEWMARLFWMDAPQPVDPAWAIERVARCSTMIWQTALDVAERGTPAVLEIGLTRRAERERFANLAQESGAPVRVHFLDAPIEERWRRVEARNRDPGENQQLAFAITRDMFDFVEAMWESPSDEEIRSYEHVTYEGVR